MNKYEKYNKEQLIKHIEELNNQLISNKYGLYWDKAIENEFVVDVLNKKIPIFQKKNEFSIIHHGANHLLIEGDNFHALSTMNMVRPLKGLVDIVYIDPPYNTGKELGDGGFVYNDKFVSLDDGFRHSKWLNFMKNRLQLGRELMKDDAVIFISIGDDEQANLKLLCDQIFGEENFIECYFWESTFRPDNSSPILRRNAEFVLCYAKNKNCIVSFKGQLSNTSGMPSLTKGKETVKTITFPANYVKTFLPDGVYYKGVKNNGGNLSWELVEDAVVKSGIFTSEVKLRGHSYWATEKKILDEINNGTEIWIKTETFVPYYSKTKESVNRPTKILDRERTQDYLHANTQLLDIFKAKKFNNPKPTSLISFLINFVDKKDALVFDFFAGSGTTGQAVLELNKDDGGDRRFILCTNNENNICTEVTYPRLKTVITGNRPDGTKYSDGIPANLHYFKCDFIPNVGNADQAKYNLVEKVNNLLCIAEDVFDLVDSSSRHYVYQSNDQQKQVFMYIDYFEEMSFNEFKKKIVDSKAETKIVYMFSTDNVVDELLFKEVKGVEIKPIPSKIYEIYKDIVEDIKRG